MKKITFIILILQSTVAFSQTNIEIDTIEVRYRIKDVIDIRSFIPQIKAGTNAIAKNKINADIREYFLANIRKDSAEYVSDLLKEYNLSTLEDYLALNEEELMPNDEKESFEISYLSENFLNVTYSYQILPYHGRYQFSFNSIQYDMQTGNKLNFDDFLTIQKDTLISILKKHGYRIEWNNDSDSSLTVPIDMNDEYVESHIESLFDKEREFRCVDFYFTEKDNDLHLNFKFECAGPYLADYGICLSNLKQYIQYSEFKNRYKLWGRNIYALIGNNYSLLGNKLEFDEYSITNTGSGFSLSNTNETGGYTIGICHSSTKTYYLLKKNQSVYGKKTQLITDILEIDKEELRAGYKLTEYCETNNGIGADIIALVKATDNNPEYYTKIIKAWRANRKTGKFESIKKRKIKRCGNEGYGI